MNHYNTEKNGALVNTSPLFASVWLALFSELRKNYNEWRLTTVADVETQNQMENK